VSEPALVAPPTDGVWHIGRTNAFLEFHLPDPVDMGEPRGGNRYDSFHGNYGVIYFGTTREACFAEVLSRLKPRPHLAALVDDEWRDRGFMTPGNIAADWRLKRTIARVVINDPLPFVDATASESLAAFRAAPKIAEWLRAFGLDDVDLSDLVGRDRRVTRLISQWLFDAGIEDGLAPRYSGVRYMSRLGEGYEMLGRLREQPTRTRADRRHPQRRHHHADRRPALRPHHALANEGSSGAGSRLRHPATAPHRAASPCPNLAQAAKHRDLGEVVNRSAPFRRFLGTVSARGCSFSR
jgi:hypothetical protein